MNIGPLEDDLVELASRLRKVVATISQSRLEIGAENRVMFSGHAGDGLRDHGIRDRRSNLLHRGIPGRPIESNQEVTIDVPGVPRERFYVGVVFTELDQTGIVQAGEPLQEAVELYEGLIAVTGNGPPHVSAAHIVESSP